MEHLNESDIQKALGKHLYLQNVCIPNVLMYQKGHKEYEADLLYFGHKSDYLTEVEIKVSFQDFKNDFKKAEYHNHPNVRNLYYAFPFDMYMHFKQEIDKLIGDAGIILIDAALDNNFEKYYYVLRYEKRSKAIKSAISLTERDKLHYLKLGCMKWVNR